jgi:hypothetical protein
MTPRGSGAPGCLVQLPSDVSRPSSGNGVIKQEKHYGPSHGDQQAPDVQSSHARLTELVEEPATRQCPHDAKRDIHNHAFTGLVHELARHEARDEPEHHPRKNRHTLTRPFSQRERPAATTESLSCWTIIQRSFPFRLAHPAAALRPQPSCELHHHADRGTRIRGPDRDGRHERPGESADAVVGRVAAHQHRGLHGLDRRPRSRCCGREPQPARQTAGSSSDSHGSLKRETQIDSIRSQPAYAAAIGTRQARTGSRPGRISRMPGVLRSSRRPLRLRICSQRANPALSTLAQGGHGAHLRRAVCWEIAGQRGHCN